MLTNIINGDNMLSKKELKILKQNEPSIEIFKKINDLNNKYYLEPLEILSMIGYIPKCNANDFRLAIETANDEDFNPTSNILYTLDLILAYFLVNDFIFYVSNKSINDYPILDTILNNIYNDIL